MRDYFINSKNSSRLVRGLIHISLIVVTLSRICSCQAIQELFPVHPNADKILSELREQGKAYGSSWDSALADLMKVCHPLNANTVAHLALSLVNIQRGFGRRIKCPRQNNLSTCAALEKLDAAGMKNLAELFVKLNAICTAVGHSNRKKGSEHMISLASRLNKAVIDEMAVLDKAIQERIKLIETESLERILQGEHDAAKTSGRGSSKMPGAAATSLTDLLAMISSLANAASNAMKELLTKGSYYLYVAYIIVTYVSLLLLSHWLTCGVLRAARQSCFLISFSNCVVHSWILHKSYSQAKDASIDAAWLTPNLTDSTQVHIAFLVLVLIIAAARRYEERTKYVNHIAAQQAQIRTALQNRQRRRRGAQAPLVI